MYLAIDLGGTKTLLAVFAKNGKLLEQCKFPTPKEYPQLLDTLVSQTATLKTKKFTHGAIGTRGLVDRENGILINDDVLGWRNKALRDDCSQRLNLDFYLENDSKLAGLSEAALVDSTYKKVLYFTISTGIGSAYIVDGVIEPHVAGSEIGKTLFERNGHLQTWESFASGHAIVEKYGKRASEIDDEETWTAITKDFAVGFVEACAVYTPDLIIVGGGVGTHFKKFEKPLLRRLTEITPTSVVIPPIIQAKRPEEAVIYGCYELIRQNQAI